MEQAKIRQYSLAKLGWLSNDKVVLLITIVYMVITFTYLFRRDLPIEGSAIVQTFHTLTFGVSIPFLLLMFFVPSYPESRVVQWLNNILNKRVIYTVGLALLIICLALNIAEVERLWWTWLSLGVLVAIFMAVVAFTNKRFMPVESIILAAGIACLWVGLWEIPYQVGLKLVYDAPFPLVTDGILRHMIAYEIVIELSLILGGFTILWYYGKKAVSINRYVIAFAILYVALMVAWYSTGFWVDIYYHWGNGVWVHSENFDKATMVIYKASKVALALSLVCLLWKGGEKEQAKTLF